MRKPNQLSLFSDGQSANQCGPADANDVSDSVATVFATTADTYFEAFAASDAAEPDQSLAPGQAVAARTSPKTKGKIGVPKAEPQPTGVPSLSDREARFLSVHQVALRLGISVPTVWRWSRERDDFPRPHRFGPGVTRWKLVDLIDFEQRSACLS